MSKKSNKLDKLDAINQLFSPSAPIESFDLFVGRMHELQQVKEAIVERGQHVVMYGGRGVGKTSLANILEELFKNISVIKVTCNRDDNFTTMWVKALKRIRIVTSGSTVGFNAKEHKKFTGIYLDDIEELMVSNITSILEEFYEADFLFIFDEYDSIADKNSKVKMADALKAISDNLPNVTVLIIGIAGSVSQLIGEHQSLERCIRQVEMLPMPNNESAQIIKHLSMLDLEVEEGVAKKIIDYASGFPHYVHLLCKFAANMAIESGETAITNQHFDQAVEQSLENSNYSIIQSYTEAIKSSRKKTQFEDVILACTLAETDEMNTFTSEEIVNKFNQITQRDAGKETINYNLGMLCKPERGNILEKTGRQKDARYRFKNPMMKAYIKLKLHNKV